MKKDELLHEIYEQVKKDPDSYLEIIASANSGWVDFKKGYNWKQTALEAGIFKLINKKTAKEWLENRSKQGYLNLDMFPEFEWTLKRIAGIE
jgi:hypothetical protein